MNTPRTAEKLYSTLRKCVAAELNQHRWIAPVVTAALAALLGTTIAIGDAPKLTLAIAAAVLLAAFLWGYSVRARRTSGWPALGHLHRRQYADTWDALAASAGAAREAVAGKTREWELRASAAGPIRNLVELASVTPADDVLEIACGIARIGLELAPQCRTWTGADISPNMLAHAAERLRGVPNARLHQLNGDALCGINSSSADVVYCTNALAHLDEIDRWGYIQDAVRVLRPGGRIFYDNINLESDEGWAMFLALAEKYRNTDLPPYMTRFSTETELTAYAARAGFTRIVAHHRPPLVIVTAIKPPA